MRDMCQHRCSALETESEAQDGLMGVRFVELQGNGTMNLISTSPDITDAHASHAPTGPPMFAHVVNSFKNYASNCFCHERHQIPTDSFFADEFHPRGQGKEEN